MMLLGIDIGTTNIKAGLFTKEGVCHSLTSRQNITYRGSDGGLYYNPNEIYQTVCSVVSELKLKVDSNQVKAIGIASMAETGLIVDKKTCLPKYPFIPWFDTRASSELDKIYASTQPLEQFTKTGIRPSYKCALSKMLWLKNQEAKILDDAIWMNVADYIAYRMTGSIKTDYSLAGRTCVFRIDRKMWDQAILETHDLDVSTFPPVVPSGDVAGHLHKESALELNLRAGIPVSISGHDHVCAAFGVRVVIGDILSEFLIDSMGTAEALMGSINERKLREQEFDSGFAFGCDVVPGRLYWMGGLSASGGSVEWMRRLLGNPQLTYEEMDRLIIEAGEEPTRILYFPYLSGSGSPHSNVNVRAAFIGLNSAHKQADMIKAVLEGTAYEMEFIRRRAKSDLRIGVDKIAAVGGGTKNLKWLQVKADVFGCPLRIPDVKNATLLGAALLAGIGSGTFNDEVEVAEVVKHADGFGEYVISPHDDRHKMYADLFENGYLAYQEPLRRISKRVITS